MMNIQTKVPVNQWVFASWEEFIQEIEKPEYNHLKCYYYNHQIRIEPMSTGPDHSKDNTIVTIALSLYGISKGIPLNGLLGCSYRKVGIRECQPDISYYIGERVNEVAQGSAVVDLDQYQPPDLVIEISDTSLSDDLGKKRLLYEELGILEYWVVDVQNAGVTAFAMMEGGSRRVTKSQALPGLDLTILEEALRRSREVDQTQIGAWLLQQFQSSLMGK